jgi:predicted transcriptional regulator of viral defense system
MVSFILFRQKLFESVCFTPNQIEVWFPDFNRNNLTRWIKKGLLIRLRQGLFTFPEYTTSKDYVYYFANRIHQPSYISLYTALSFYGMIPETIVPITSITSIKTAVFKNKCGEYSYRSIKKDLFFGYDLKVINGGQAIKLATAEKALLDLFYIYPFYRAETDMLNLRFNEEFLKDSLNIELLLDYASRYKNKSFQQRLNVFINAYNLI